MRADLFLDTNILLYAASRSESEKDKRDIARQLLMSDDVGISSQVLAEFYVNATAKLKLPEKEVIAILEAMSDYPTLPVDAELFWAALEIRKRYGISYWDSAIVAAAVKLGSTAVYSEDLNHGQKYAGVRMINPFLKSSEKR